MPMNGDLFPSVKFYSVSMLNKLPPFSGLLILSYEFCVMAVGKKYFF